MLPVFVLLYSLQLNFFFFFSGGGFVPHFIFFLHPLLIPEHANIRMKFLQTTHFRTNAYMCTQIGMHVALSRVISNSLGLSQTASRCAQLADIPAARHRTYTSTLVFKRSQHTACTPTYERARVIRGTIKETFLLP